LLIVDIVITAKRASLPGDVWLK